jgi:transcriptional regulator with XRE-family HTH domain
MSPSQCRMARAALQIGVRDLADMAKVSPSTVARFEAGEELKERTVEAMRAALESAGVEFIAENGGGPGVRLKKTARASRKSKAVAESDLTKLKARRKRIRSDRSK